LIYYKNLFGAEQRMDIRVRSDPLRLNTAPGAEEVTGQPKASFVKSLELSGGERF
jgi:hypothetical protein